MADDAWKLAQAEIYLLTHMAEAAWNDGTPEQRAEKIATMWTGLIGMLNTMSESLLATLPESERDALFEQAGERITARARPPIH